MTDDGGDQRDAENAPSVSVDASVGSAERRVDSESPCVDPNDHRRGGRVDGEIRTLVASATRDREAFESPASPPDEDRALKLLREGFGPAVWVYVEGHTGGRNREFSSAELALLQRAMNDWLELYARCYGVELDATFTVREAAKLLVETRNVRETAQLLTRVPER